MAKGKNLALPTGVTGDYHPIGSFQVRRPAGDPTRTNPHTGTVVVDVCHFVSETARRAGVTPLMTRSVSIALGDMNQATVEAFLGELWKHVNVAIQADIDSGDGPFKDFDGATDVFESGQAPTP